VFERIGATETGSYSTLVVPLRLMTERQWSSTFAGPAFSIRISSPRLLAVNNQLPSIFGDDRTALD
jgi:hypothetical protein